ncbi:hypothetical protein OIE67_32145 [Nonomuraea fuscirosea]|uniref:hypothetical protein n=1 Tax=Nonomuraea fuscirosea TaxID=1291556 RepID=UPI002DDA3CAF|nr:hypothetical protein [Nonomuraea fuscirosea]WSA48722.1 hypothetical protein OIE67_32145 [Nonomuraea fuscirosea]
MGLFPETNQWELLTAAGLRGDFQAAWIEGDDVAAIAAEAGCDPGDTLDCGLTTALRWHGLGSRATVAWMGPHAPGWTFALVLGEADPRLGLTERRVFDLWYAREIDEFSGPGALYEEEGLDDLDLNDDVGGEDDLEPHLVAVGRITGRFVDAGWLAERRTLRRVTAS